jgi:1,2-diacylglycerol 3-alpha-glucosyltransferase
MLACPGLEHAHRGFETFARECFEALRRRDDLEIELVKGTGERRPGETVIPTLTRRTRTARAIGRALSTEPFVVEHLAFALALVPLVVRRRPDVVYFSEWHVGRILAASRRIARRPFALAFCNGALVPSGYGHLDVVQQLVPGALEYTIARGEPPDRQVLLPLGVAVGPHPSTLGDADRDRLRSRLSLPPGRRIVLSAGAINRQKRIDYLIEEIASLPEPRPYLVVAGEEEPDTRAIRALAHERLGPAGHDFRTLQPSEMAELYRASDVFVLASLWESFGRVLVEAQSHGLPTLAHDYPAMKWVLGDQGHVADLRVRGGVANWLENLSDTDFSPARRAARHRAAYTRFSWETLAGRYAEMLSLAAQRGSER